MSYAPHTDAERRAMLEAIGVASMEDLFAPIPEDLRLRRALNVPPALDEYSLLRDLRQMADKNADLDRNVCFLGAGVYDHFIPAAVNAILSRGEFLTAYTPYQPEVSQGMLQALYEFQSLVCELTGMELANASMYDAATALAEAALMAIEVTGRQTAVVARTVHPHYRAVLRTYLDAAGFQLREVGIADGTVDPADLRSALDSDAACFLIQTPNFLGQLEDLRAAIEVTAKAGALSVVCADPISLGLLVPPGRLGADVVVGEGQPLGCPTGFGGPLLGLFACKQKFQRKFPGRIVGATVDQDDRRAYTMTLRTREQDIRRDKATSNICTNETLLALGASVYLTCLGPAGLRGVATACAQNAHYAMDRLTAIHGVDACFTGRYFNEFAVRLPDGCSPALLQEKLLQRGILGAYDLGSEYPELAGCALFCATETRTRDEIDALAAAVGDIVTEACGTCG